MKLKILILFVMVFYLFVEAVDYILTVYEFKVNASYSELEEASQSETFVEWLMANSTLGEYFTISDTSSNDFRELMDNLGRDGIGLYSIISSDKAKALPVPEEEANECLDFLK